MLTKQQIIDQCFNEKGNVNNRVIQLINDGRRPLLRDSITNLTSFLIDASVMQRLWHIVNDIFMVPRCECGNLTNFKYFKVGYLQYCSIRCVGSSKVRESKRLQTNMVRYGVSNAMHNQEVLAKLKETNMEKYGVEFPLQNQSILEKTKSSDVWGFKNEHTRKKADNAKIDLYGTTHGNPKSFEHITDVQRTLLGDGTLLRKWHHEDKFTLTEIAEKIDVDRSTIIKAFSRHKIDTQLYHQSSQERKVCELLSELNVSFITNDRKLIPPLELDIVIPDHKIAIEVNGLWYHSDRYGYDKKRHEAKTIQCQKLGYRLIHLYDYEINNKWDICASVIRSAISKNTKVGARKLIVDICSSEEQRIFANQNHLQGVGMVSPTAYCLRDRDHEIIAMMTFGKSRFSKSAEWELLRYVVKRGHNVVGGASKLFKHFIKHHSPKNVISYCDRRIFTGGVYRELGFSLTHISKPNYWYFDTKYDRLYHRVHFQKHKLQNKLKLYNPDLTEWENMVQNQWNRIWDCGNYVFMWVTQ